jgi:predicted RNase H-like nuclease (RuvC/YqgF family)
MFVDAESLGTFAGYIGSLFIFGFAIVRVLDRKAETRQDRMEKRHAEEMSAIRQDLADKHYSNTREFQSLHQRVNDVKDRHVKQETHDRDIAMIRDSIKEFRAEIKQEINSGVVVFNQSLGDLRKDFTGLLMDIASRLKLPND